MERNAKLAYVHHHRRKFVDSIFEMMEKDPVAFKTMLKIMVVTPDFLSRDGRTPLQVAAGKGDSEMVCRLLERGSNHSYNGGVAKNSPLHVAAAIGDVVVCEILLQYWAAPYVRNLAGKSPAQLANENGHFNCAMLINNFLHDKYMQRIISQNNIHPRLRLPPDLYEAFYALVRDAHLNPLKIALNSMTFVRRRCFPGLHNALKLLRDKEIKDHQGMNMAMLLKLHYMCCVLEKFVELEANAEQRKQLGVKNGPELFLRKLSSKNRYKRNRIMSGIVTKAAESLPWRNSFRAKVLDSLANRGFVCSVTVLAAIVNEREEAEPYVKPCGFCCGPVVSVLCEKCGIAIWCNEACKGYDKERHRNECQSEAATEMASPT